MPGPFYSSILGSGGTSFGHGLLCTAGQITRLGVVSTDVTGTAIAPVGLAQQEGLQAGAWRRYQYWYRDPLGRCGMGFNTTNAFDVRW